MTNKRKVEKMANINLLKSKQFSSGFGMSGKKNGNQRKISSISITVNEFYKMNLKQISTFFQNEFKWGLARVGFYIYIALILLTFGLFGLVTAPITSRIFFNTWNARPYLKFFVPMVMQGYKILFMFLKDRKYKFMFSVPLTDQPLKSPDRNNVKLAGNWVHEENTCYKCIRCCDKISCPLLNQKQGTCLSYDSFYWNYFLCGRYPFTHQQVEYYECPKWEIKYDEIK